MPPGKNITNNSLEAFFSPGGIAVIGASHNPTKLGYGLARNLLGSNYQGAVHFVNPKGGSLLGLPIYTNIRLVPDPVDLAILLIPAAFIPQALEDCGQRGLRAAIVGSGGFRETGQDGAALEEQCYHIAKSYGMRLIGPNSIGLIDTHLPLDATFLPPPGPLPGEVAFISHSGAICAAVIDWARGRNFGLSRLVSLGNQTDVNETDVLAPVAADPFTRVLTLYLEGVGDGRRFVAEAGQITCQKPIIALKVGRFESGQRAAASHTGALSGREDAFDAAFRRAGVIRASASEEMFDWARALAWCPLPKGRGVAVLTNAGGPGVTAADALESSGMHLSELNSETSAALREFLPPAASLGNPVDMLASASPEQYAQSLEVLLRDEHVHSALVILPPPPMFTAGAVAKALIPVIHQSDKPVIIALMGERLIQEAVEHFRAARVPEYRFPERAASALAVLAQRAEALSRSSAGPVIFPDIDQEDAKARLKTLHSSEVHSPKTDGFLPVELVFGLIKAYGIATPSIGLARSPEEAIELARSIGFPVALKVSAEGIAHKSDVGGLVLNLFDDEAVSQGYRRVVENARRARPGAKILGVFVQSMVTGGQEVIVGAVQDPQFGPLVMFGSGGVEVEGVRDVAFALAPITDEEANYLLDSTWAGRKLAGYRNQPPADRDAAKETIIRLAQLASDFPQLAEIEINPLKVNLEGQGVCALDVRGRLKD